MAMTGLKLVTVSSLSLPSIETIYVSHLILEPLLDIHASVILTLLVTKSKHIILPNYVASCLG